MSMYYVNKLRYKDSYEHGASNWESLTISAKNFLVLNQCSFDQF